MTNIEKPPLSAAEVIRIGDGFYDTAYQAAESIAEEIEALREEAIPYCRNVEMVGLPKDIVTKFSDLRARVEDADLDHASKAASLDLLDIESLSRYCESDTTFEKVALSQKILPNGLKLYTSSTKPVKGDDSADHLFAAYVSIALEVNLNQNLDVASVLDLYHNDVLSRCKKEAGDNKELADYFTSRITLAWDLADEALHGKTEMVPGKV